MALKYNVGVCGWAVQEWTRKLESLDFILNVSILLMYIMEYLIPGESHNDKVSMKSVMFYMS